MVMGVLGDFQKTIKCHEKVLSIDPEFIEAIFGKGMALGILEETILNNFLVYTFSTIDYYKFMITFIHDYVFY